jgi:hypothetical protein
MERKCFAAGGGGTKGEHIDIDYSIYIYILFIGIYRPSDNPITSI